MAPVVLGLSMLAAAAAFVLVVLPAWVARRPPSVAPGTTAPVAAPPATSTTVPPASTAAARVAPEPPVEEPAVGAPPVEEEPAGEEPALEEETVAPGARSRPDPGPPAAAERAEVPGGDEWTRAMSEGLAALDRGEFAEARTALARAESARPGAATTADAMRRAEDGLKGEALSAHRARGASAEAREDWKAALAEYEAALRVEPQVTFAIEGRLRSLPRAQMEERLAGYARQPERLGTEAVAREAEATLARAREMEPAGPRLRQQTAAVERLLQEARTTVDVRLVSDGLTDVVVLRVATLGAFRERTLSLRPGSYVVVGRRQGYRDARKTFVVSPARVPPPLDVRCVEAL